MTFNSVDIARVAHEVNRAIQKAQNDPAPSPAWDDAPEWQRDSAIKGVEVALDGATPEELHLSWVKEKLKEGWIYGEAKNAVLKTHPCLAAYVDLPEEQKLKDYVFQAIVTTLHSIGQEVGRVQEKPQMAAARVDHLALRQLALSFSVQTGETDYRAQAEDFYNFLTGNSARTTNPQHPTLEGL